MNQVPQNGFEAMCKSVGLAQAVAHDVSLCDADKISAAVGRARVKNCQNYRSELTCLSEQETNDDSKFVYALLSDVCSLRLEETGKRLKYVPFAMFSDRCSLRIEEISDEVAALLDALVQKIRDPILRARVADVAYERTDHDAKSVRKDRLESVLAAYSEQVTYDRMNWRTHGKFAWRRFVELSRSVGTIGDPYRERAIGRLYADLQNLQGEDAVDVCNFIVEQDLDCSRNRELLHRKLVEAYNGAQGEAQYLVRDSAGEGLIALARRSKNGDDEIASLTFRGDGWMMDGDACVERDDLVMAAHRYEVAEKWYRKIPKESRSNIEWKRKHCVEGRRKGYAKWSDELRRVTVYTQDISSEVSAVEKFVTVEDLNEAIVRFARVCDFNLSEFNKAVSAYSGSLGSAKLFQVTYLSADGRVEARKEGDDASRIEAEGFARLWLPHAVQARILPAYNIIRGCHFDRQYFRDMVSDSKFPQERVESVALGLWLGFFGEWRTASAILIPQIEHLVCTKLRDAGVEVLHGKSNTPVEDYTSLSTLLSYSQSPVVLGEVDHKELMLLFGPAPNLNWRNNIAHGLVDDASAGEFYPVDVYVWHRVLRFCLTSR